jgi:hypothetical protein
MDYDSTFCRSILSLLHEMIIKTIVGTRYYLREQRQNSKAGMASNNRNIHLCKISQQQPTLRTEIISDNHNHNISTN